MEAVSASLGTIRRFSYVVIKRKLYSNVRIQFLDILHDLYYIAPILFLRQRSLLKYYIYIKHKCVMYDEDAVGKELFSKIARESNAFRHTSFTISTTSLPILMITNILKTEPQLWYSYTVSSSAAVEWATMKSVIEKYKTCDIINNSLCE